jgi:hypothetical protein
MSQENDKQMAPRTRHKKLFSTLTKYRLPFGRIPAYLREYTSVMPTVA